MLQRYNVFLFSPFSLYTVSTTMSSSWRKRKTDESLVFRMLRTFIRPRSSFPSLQFFSVPFSRFLQFLLLLHDSPTILNHFCLFFFSLQTFFLLMHNCIIYYLFIFTSFFPLFFCNYFVIKDEGKERFQFFCFFFSNSIYNSSPNLIVNESFVFFCLEMNEK